MKRLFSLILLCVVFVLFIYYAKRDAKVIIEKEIRNIVINVNDRDLLVELEDNTSAEAFYKRLKKESITVNTHDYGNFEKVGDLNFELPRNDTVMETKAGDLILYEGNKITLYYDTNKYKFTKLGHVKNVDKFELKELLGEGDAVLKFIAK